MQRRRGDDEIGLRKHMSRLATVLDQKPPFEHDVFADGDDALLEHRPHLVREPVVQFGAAGGIVEAFDAEADFGESHRTDIEQIERLRGNKGENFGLRPKATQFREYIRIEQPSRHRWRPRTGMRACSGSMSVS